MPNTQYKLFAERLLLYNITAEPTELTVPILSYLPTAIPSIKYELPVVIPNCDIKSYIIISVVTSVFTTLCLVFAAHYLRERCKSRYLDDIASASSVSSSSFESNPSHIIDLEPGMADELFWFEDVYNVDQEDVYNVDT